LRGNVLVSRGVPEDGADVDSALVGKGAASDERLVVAERPIGDLRDKGAESGNILELVGADGCMAHLQFQVGNDGRQGRVSATLAVPIDTALHERCSGL